MGKIADKAREFWGYGIGPVSQESMQLFAETIDVEFKALRQEIQDLKDKEPTFEEKMMKIVIDTKAQLAKVEAQVFGGRVPEPELQRGDFVSYGSDYTKKKVWGIFHHYDGNKVYAYWQDEDGSFPFHLGYMFKSRVTFEFRPEK